MSWYSKLLTHTTFSRLLASENDGDTEDDTHVCRVLRAYYTEQGRSFPPWLPPDPKAPPPAAPVSSQPQVGSRYGGLAHQQNPSGSLSSLWDSNPTQPQQTQPPQHQRLQGSQSLRQHRVAAPASRPSPFDRGGGGVGDVHGRESATATAPPTNQPAGGGSAQDRLKQRLWGGGSRTTSPGSGTQGPFQPPGSGSSGYGVGGTARGGGGGGSAGDRPYMGANANWNTGAPRGGGLPSGPKM
ncbi:hypothetical protein ACRALDRAFT_1059404, partial [Sodiomyces alcalophilus JCM 7366]|uniref:uncharacterized protein n=1 Tax=Sodiomyces alcalophilus JCM 7366 TaxID=591952 RepID=UPI0039B58C7F